MDQPATTTSRLDGNIFLAGMVILVGTVLASTLFIAWAVGADLLFPLFLMAVSGSATVALVVTALREERAQRADESPDEELAVGGHFEPMRRG